MITLSTPKNNFNFDERFPVESIEFFWKNKGAAVDIHKVCLSNSSPTFINNYCIQIIFKDKFLYVIPNQFNGWHYNIYETHTSLPIIKKKDSYFDITILKDVAIDYKDLNSSNIIEYFESFLDCA